MKTFIVGTAALAALCLTGCTYYHTTEQPAPRNTTTVVVPRASAPQTVVVPAPPSTTVRPMPSTSDSDTVTVDPDTTVVVSPNPN